MIKGDKTSSKESFELKKPALLRSPFPPPNAHIDSKTCTKYNRTFISSNVRCSSDFPRIETEPPCLDDPGEENPLAENKKNLRRKNIFGSRKTKCGRTIQNAHRSRSGDCRRKNLHFLVPPAGNRREAQAKIVIPICTMIFSSIL